MGLPQTLYSGLAFGKDGTHLYAVFDSLTAPQGTKAPEGNRQTGNAIAVYDFSDGNVKAEQLLPVPLQQLAAGKLQNPLGVALPAGTAIPSPAGIAVRKGPAGSDELLVADNLSDDVLLMDGVTGKVLRRFDLSQGNVVPSTYPISIAVNRAGSRAYVALWNGSAVAELDLNNGKVVKKLDLLAPREPTSPSSHPAAFAWSPDEKTLYVALANRDAVAAMRVGGASSSSRPSTTPGCPGRPISAPCRMRSLCRRMASGSLPPTPVPTPSRCLICAGRQARARKSAVGWVPTEWYPTALAVKGNMLYVATAKGQGTGPNNMPQPHGPGEPS